VADICKEIHTMKSLVGVLILFESVLAFQSSTEKYLAQVSHKDENPQFAGGTSPVNDSFYNNGQMIPMNDIDVSSMNSQNALLNQESYAMQQSNPTTTAIVLENGDMNIEALVGLSKEDLVVTLVNYQNWMRQYMIDAQEQKYRAVKAAEEALNRKWSEALSAMDPSATPLPPTTTSSSSSSSSQQSPLFAARNMAVSRAGAAGRSRWGDVEVQRARSGSVIQKLSESRASSPQLMAARRAATKAPLPPMSTPPSRLALMPTGPVPVPVEVAEADHGLRADGGVGGWTLAERVYFGAAAPDSSSATTSPTMSSPASSFTSSVDSSGISFGGIVLSPSEVLYTQRNIRILQAAQNGKSSRWGEPEINRVSNILAAMTPQLLEAAASHRYTSPAPASSSSVSLLSDQQRRINLGASIVSTH
jgi:hypothetical protein